VVEAAKKKNISVIKVHPFIGKKVEYLDADTELLYKLGSANINRDEYGNITDQSAYVRAQKDFMRVHINEIDYVDVTPSQIAGLGVALIPFVQNDDPGRTFYGAKTQNQAYHSRSSNCWNRI
jgi:DNA-directed RNA polymerase subunit beta